MDSKTSLATVLGVLAGVSLWLVMINQAPVQPGEFGIYLVKDNIKVVSSSDVLSYKVSTHELTLTSECIQKLKKLGYLSGEFKIVVNGQVELKGIFVPPVISRSYPPTQIVITYPSMDSDYKTMMIQMGYPWNQPGPEDPRDNPRIEQYFRGLGKLTS